MDDRGFEVGEDRLSAAEQLAQRYRSLVEHTPDGICVHERGIIVYVNPATVRMLAASGPEDLVGRPLVQFVHPDSVPGMLDRISRLTRAGAASTPAEMTLLRLDGTQVPVETVSVLTVWHDQAAYQVVIHDLSAQRAAEAAQRRAEQHFTTVVSQLEEGVAVIDRDGRIESVNPAARRIFGIEDAGDLAGVSIAELPLTLLDTNAQPMSTARHPVARTLATGETITGYVFGVDRSDGQRRWLSGSSRLLNPGDPDSSAVSSFADITEYRASRRHLEYQATHDSLTGLANRSLILSQLAGALAASEDLPVSVVMFIDLDGFKAINDSLGHAIGDTVLQIVAQRLQRALRADDIVGRLGGDEFLVLLSGRTRQADLDALILRLQRTMAEPIVARGHRIEVNASIGVTALRPGDRRTPEAVLHDADVAMYRAKPAGHREGLIGPARRPNNTHAS
ncbi:diguanylate cyclase domain-containing protein [Nocardia cyriacigeorgica]|uniref:diguanylate cyclase domain-containing protein n=1 Tax=Nocardia cyriacigeorgica TaxID=135487 RepID=UPI0013D416EE|nr:diguanylate cyclase [Nocardia cyriacigeorgica]NEW27754.1 diguanylate cyclase [Nocardia cyriacigeorgica]